MEEAAVNRPLDVHLLQRRQLASDDSLSIVDDTVETSPPVLGGTEKYSTLFVTPRRTVAGFLALGRTSSADGENTSSAGLPQDGVDVCLPINPKGDGRKHGTLRPQKPVRLIRDGEAGGSRIFIPNTYSLHCHHQNDSALRLSLIHI